MTSADSRFPRTPWFAMVASGMAGAGLFALRSQFRTNPGRIAAVVAWTCNVSGGCVRAHDARL